MPKKCCFLQLCLSLKTREEVITKLDFSNTVLSDDFPEIWEHERTLEDLCLNSTRISSLPPQFFYCQGLRVLSISNNNLENIPDAIGSLRQLQFLNISRNYISNIPDNLKNCKNLTHLDLSCNNLQRLPDAITCLVSLQELFLNETYLEFLPANFGRLVNLRILELRLNSLITLPKSMCRLGNLQRIDIGGNEFTELPAVITELQKLQELWIDLNQIRRFPANVGKLQNLQHFEANGNLIEELPNDIGTWHNVEVFSICTNNLKKLPSNFGGLKSLVTLKCEYCDLIELPDVFGSLEQLEEIVVSHNRLILLPKTIGMLRKLRFLFADDNHLQNIPDEICSCAVLTVLSLSSNQLIDLPQNIGHLTKLKVLNLVGNYISTLPVSVLNMTSLSSLWLSDNQSQPLVPLQYVDVNSKTRLTCFMLPQNHLENALSQVQIENTTSRHTTTTSPTTRRICFASSMDEQSSSSSAIRSDYHNDVTIQQSNDNPIISEENYEPRLMRSPTPYPKELRMMSKYMRSGNKSPHKSERDVKEARIIANRFTHDFIPNNIENQQNGISPNEVVLSSNPNEIDNDNQHERLYNVQSLNVQPNYSIAIPNHTVPYNQFEYVIYPEMERHYNMSALSQYDYEQEFPKDNLYNANVYNNEFNGDGSVMVEAAAIGDGVSLDLDKTYLRNYAQQPQQFMTPPPYHIARNYTKKTLQDLSNYDSMRNQQKLHPICADEQNRGPSTSLENISAQGFPTTYDEENNLLAVGVPNQLDSELIDCSGDCAEILQNKAERNDECSDKPNTTTNSNILVEASLSPDFGTTVPNSNGKKMPWLFGRHRNPTVKQITIKKEEDHPTFFIGRKSNEEGIYVLSIVPNSNASRFLFIDDKLLEVNGHDFTDISLEEATHILATADTSINIMLSRK